MFLQPHTHARAHTHTAQQDLLPRVQDMDIIGASGTRANGILSQAEHSVQVLLEALYTEGKVTQSLRWVKSEGRSAVKVGQQ